MNLSDFTFRALLITLTIVFVPLLGVSLYFIQQEQEAAVQLDLESRAAEVARSTAETLRLSVENLQAASSILLFRQDINFNQFKELTARYFTADPGLLIMEWQPVVPGDEREAFEQRARGLGLVGFRFWQPDDEGQPVNVPFRDEHVPVYLMRSRYPEADDINTLGLDLAWSPERMFSKWQARDQGRAESSDFFSIILGPSENRSPLGFAITLPLYENGIVPDTQTGRRAKILGYLAGVYSVQLLLETQINQLREDGIYVEIYNDASSDMRLSVNNGETSQYSREIQSTLFGSTWYINLNATDRFVSARFDPIWYLLPGGLTLLFGITVIFLFLQEKARKQLSLAHHALEQANQQLADLARHDSLTGLLTRRAFLSRLEQTLNELERHPNPTALLMIDLDWFKSVNDQWGHATGDEVLKTFATTCMEITRKTDAVGRLGGEEFAILMPLSEETEAEGLAERLRVELSQKRVSTGDGRAEVRFTVSIGYTVTSTPVSPEAWLAEADKALYEAKAAGRNRVTAYDAHGNVHQLHPE